MAVLALVLFLLIKICIGGGREGDVTKRENFIFWPDGVIPFYIESRHFDKDQQLAITSALAKFSFKTCLQFKPVFAEPKPDRHVLVLENPHGIRKCVINTQGHAIEEPHRLTIGFDCMASPNIDMMIMRALGFPFEHNRASRDIYIDVLFENVDQGAIELYTKEQKLPLELRALPYDVNSVMHFDNREYSKNGHRTFIFKNPNTHQNRVGLSPTDLQKINIIYGPECKTRDRLTKLKICSNYPVNNRRKRELDSKKNATNPLKELENKNDTDLLIGAEKNDTNKPIEVEKNVTNLPLISKENSEDKNIARQSDMDMDKLVVELVRKLRQVRRLSIALAKRKNKSTRTEATDEEMALAIINSLYTSLEDKTITDDESTSDFKSLRSDFCETVNGYKGKQFYSTQIRQTVRCKKDKSDDCESTERDYATTKMEKIGFNDKQFHSTKIKSARFFTQLRTVFTSTQYAKGREKAGYKEEDSSTRQKREANGTSEGSNKAISLEVSTITHNASNIENTTLKIDKVARKTFMHRGIFGTEDKGNIKIENYAAVTLPLFGGIATENVKEEREMVKEESFDEKEIIDEQMTTKKRKVDLNAGGDDVQFSSASKNEFGTTKKVDLLAQTVQLSQGNKDFYGERIWPEGIVHFAIENNPNYDLNDVRQRLEEVNKILQAYTCVQLQEINEEDKKITDYIVLDCSADYVVGRVGGKQKFGVMELFEGGQHRQHAAMVVMGMLGFYFEAARHDRDQYVLVHTRHIRPDKVHHFEKLHADATLALPYDYRSATHPPWQYWRRLGKSGISSVATYKDKDPDGKIMKSLGQNSRLLSKIDLVKINSVYGTSCFQDPNDI